MKMSLNFLIQIKMRSPQLIVQCVMLLLLANHIQTARQGQDIRCGGRFRGYRIFRAVQYIGFFYLFLNPFMRLALNNHYFKPCIFCQSACRALVDEMEWAISQVDPKKMIQTGSFRINPDGSQSIREVRTRLPWYNRSWYKYKSSLITILIVIS